MKKVKKGFTLIELLVVIAIIGILAAIIIVAVDSARNKAKDARIKSDLSQVRSAAEVLYTDNESYSGLSTTNPAEIGKLDSDVRNLNGGTGIVIQVSNDGKTYLAYTKLASGGYWCVDSASAVKAENQAPSGTDLSTPQLCP
jgi:prepilin-type N-terminal cleavage/methylation domain-containing protein